MQNRIIPNNVHDENNESVKGNQFLRSIENKIEQLEFEGIKKLAESALFSFPGEPDQINSSFAWLKWVQSDEKSSKIWWEWIRNNKKELKERDKYILKLWRTIDYPSNADRKSVV